MRPVHLLPAVLVAAALAAGCGGGGDASSGTTSSGPPNGAELFASESCASCHTLAAADAHGMTGPDLDDLKPSVTAVRDQVTHGGGGMPAFGDDLSSAQIDAIASYVAGAAGR